MATARVENRSGTYPVSAGSRVLSTSEREVTLVDLLRVVIGRRLLVLAVLVACLLAAGSYLMLAKPVYRAIVHLLPPQQPNIQGLVIGSNAAVGPEDSSYTPDFVYNAFLDNLKSQGLRREFFDRERLVEHYLGDKTINDDNVDRVFKEKFDNNLQVRVNRTDQSFVSVSFSANDPEFASNSLNQFIDFANTRTIDQLVSGVDAALKGEIAEVSQRMASKLKFGEQRRLDSITKLKEALRVATTLGIKDTSSFPKISDRTQASLAVNVAQVPLYMRGTDALEAELQVLESRKSNEPFIDGFRDLQERREFLEGVTVDRDSLSAVTIDKAATPPYRSEYPRYGATLLVACLLGLVLGLVAAFFAEFVTTVKGELASPGSRS